MSYLVVLKIKDFLSANFLLLPIDWEAISAVMTFLTALVAVSIAIYGHKREEERSNESRKKEAMEKILVPIRKELLTTSQLAKWYTWNPGHRWNTVRELMRNFPLPYFWLDEKMRKRLNDFETRWECFANLSNQEKTNFDRIIVQTILDFLKNHQITISCSSGGSGHIENAISNMHWRCVVGGKSGAAVTIQSLVLGNYSLSAYLEERKRDEDIPNNKIDEVIFSTHCTSALVELNPKPTINQSDIMLCEIGHIIDKDSGVSEYRKRWQELYKDKEKLLEEIESWLSTD